MSVRDREPVLPVAVNKTLLASMDGVQRPQNHRVPVVRFHHVGATRMRQQRKERISPQAEVGGPAKIHLLGVLVDPDGGDGVVAQLRHHHLFEVVESV